MRTRSDLLRGLLKYPDSGDPIGTRRYRLLAIILIGLVGLCMLTLVAVLLRVSGGALEMSKASFIIWTCVAFGPLCAGIIVLARRRLNVAVWILLLLSTVPNFFADSPQEVMYGDGLFFLCVPVFLSGVLLSGRSCIFYNSLLLVGLLAFGLVSGVGVNPVGLIALLALGVVAWLSANGMEQSLRNLLDLTATLEQRVAERTDELAQTNVTLELRVAERTAEARRLAEDRERTQQALIEAQQGLIRELQAPVESLAPGIVLMTLIGQIDISRADSIVRSMLKSIERMGARVAIISVYGVTAVDTITANLLVRAAQSARLLGCQVALTGMRSDVAQTMVGLGVDLSAMNAFATVHDALAWATAICQEQGIEE